MVDRHVKYFNIDIRRNNQQNVDMKAVSMEIIIKVYALKQNSTHKIFVLYNIIFKTLRKKTQ